VASLPAGMLTLSSFAEIFVPFPRFLICVYKFKIFLFLLLFSLKVFLSVSHVSLRLDILLNQYMAPKLLTLPKTKSKNSSPPLNGARKIVTLPTIKVPPPPPLNNCRFLEFFGHARMGNGSGLGQTNSSSFNIVEYNFDFVVRCQTRLPNKSEL